MVRPSGARRARPTWLVPPVLAATVWFVAALGAPSAPAGTDPGGDVSRGGGDQPVRSVYLRDCATCHDSDGSGTDRGPDITDAGAALVDFELRTGRMPLDDPDATPQRGEPAYGVATREPLVDYVVDLGGRSGPDIPQLDLAGADVAQGGVTYRADCAACHQSVGQGGALIDTFAPPLDQADPVEVAEAVRSGPGTMPVFPPEELDDQALADLVAYVGVLQDPEDRGGLALAHLGPLPEGAVAWVFGVGVMLVGAVLIERRAHRAG